MLLLFLYSCLTFYRTWKKNYRMPDGIFYFEEKTVETQGKLEIGPHSSPLNIFFFHRDQVSRAEIGDQDFPELCSLGEF